MIPDKLFVPQKTEAEKLASIDSQIESCLKILYQEIEKRAELSKNPERIWMYAMHDKITEAHQIYRSKIQ